MSEPAEQLPADTKVGIDFRDVTVAYSGIKALESLSLTIHAGEVMALIGPSGSGKTTALRCVAGFVAPTHGRIHLGDRDVTDVPPRNRHTSMVVQQYALFPHMRVDENVAFGLRAQHVPKHKIAPRVQESLRLVGMADYAERYPRELSGGQQQRVAIARAIAVEPRVLLLDEPLSALDAQLRAGMLSEIARLHRELPDLTILYVTHDQSEALTIANRIAIMHDSRLVDVGTPEQLYQRPSTPFTAEFLGNANLIPVQLEQQDVATGRAQVTLAGKACSVSLLEAMPDHGEHVLCVRPHALRLESHADCDNQIEARLQSVQWLGSVYRMVFDCQGHELSVEAMARQTPPAPGTDMVLHFASTDATLIQAEAVAA